MSENLNFILNRTFVFKTNTIAILEANSYSLGEQLIVIIILNILDSSNCLAIDAIDLTKLFKISKRHIYRLLNKLIESSFVKKEGKRYDFSYLVQLCEKST
jgi:hypothetical protein